MNCLSCDGAMEVLWTVDTDHDGSTAGWSPKSVCPNCTPNYYRRFSK